MAALAVMVGTSIVLGLLLDAVWPTPASIDADGLALALKAALATGIGAFAGGWIARGGLLPLAIVLWAIQWAVQAQVLARMAGPDGAGGRFWAEVLLRHQNAIAATLLATVLGVWLGQRLAARRHPRVAG